MKKISLVLILSLTTLALQAQNGVSQIGARSAAMGYTGATLQDHWAVFNNPAGLSVDKGLSVLAAFENRYGLSGLNNISAAVVSALPLGTAGVSIFRFGDDLYNEHTLSLTYSNTFGIASLGLKANYLQYNLEGFGSAGILTLDLGGIATLAPTLIVGAYIRNINQAKVSAFQDERAPTLLNAGLSYRPTGKVMLNLEAEKDIDFETSLKVGLEYKFLKKFVARTGIKTNEYTNYFGLGFKSKPIEIDYALTRDQRLGYSHQASLSYSFLNK